MRRYSPASRLGDLARRAVRYSQLSVDLHLAQTRLARSESMKGLETTIYQTERNLLLEIWEWFQICLLYTSDAADE